MNNTRTIAFAVAALACLGAFAAQAAPNFVPLTAQTPLDLKYAGSIHHANGTGHTFLANTLEQCNAMIWQSVQDHAAHALPNCDQTDTRNGDPCGKRGFFELSAPTGGNGGGVTTVLLHLPTDFVRAVGDLRERYRIDAYEAERAKLGGE